MHGVFTFIAECLLCCRNSTSQGTFMVVVTSSKRKPAFIDLNCVFLIRVANWVLLLRKIGNIQLRHIFSECQFFIQVFQEALCLMLSRCEPVMNKCKKFTTLPIFSFTISTIHCYSLLLHSIQTDRQLPYLYP